MMHSVTCPTCQHKQLLDESEMAKLQCCPHCQTSFVAGKSSAESRGGLAAASVLQQQPIVQQQPSYAKTMLTDEDAPPIKYTCPRCKAPLEAPASQGAMKTNCPHCSQRHQVPAASKPAAPAPALNKTMLAGDESSALPPPSLPPIKFNCPNCKKPLEAPANEGGTKKNCTYCAQRLQVPAAPSPELEQNEVGFRRLRRHVELDGCRDCPGYRRCAARHTRRRAAAGLERRQAGSVHSSECVDRPRRYFAPCLCRPWPHQRRQEARSRCSGEDAVRAGKTESGNRGKEERSGATEDRRSE